MSAEKAPRRLFELGQVVATPGAMAALDSTGNRPTWLLAMHQMGLWGDVVDHDQKVNDEAVENGTRIMSVYPLNETKKVWIITEADRSVTTILLPDEY